MVPRRRGVDALDQLLHRVGALLLVVAGFFGLRWLLASRYGKLLRASRDGSNRLRFLGYDPAPYKVIAFTVASRPNTS